VSADTLPLTQAAAAHDALRILASAASEIAWMLASDLEVPQGEVEELFEDMEAARVALAELARVSR
jgi:hypothetical protein